MPENKQSIEEISTLQGKLETIIIIIICKLYNTMGLSDSKHKRLETTALELYDFPKTLRDILNYIF